MSATLGEQASPPPVKRLEFGRAPAVQLGTPPPRPAPAPAAVPEPAAAPSSQTWEEVGATSQERARPRRRRGRRPVDLDGVGVYVPASIRDRLRDYHRTHEGSTYTDILLDAIDECADEELARLCAPRYAQRAGGRFAGRVPRRSRQAEPQVQVTIRPNPADLAVIDELVARHAAGNRSELVRAVLDRYLPLG